LRVGMMMSIPSPHIEWPPCSESKCRRSRYGLLRTSLMLRQPHVAVIVVTYNSANHIGACLRSITCSAATVEVQVVDNASVDATLDEVRRHGPAVHLMPLDQNMGFARAADLGAARASQFADFIFLLNPDVVLFPGALDALASAAVKNPHAGLWGGRMLDAHRRLDHRSCLQKPSLWQALAFALRLTAIPVLDPDRLGRWDRTTDREVPVLTGAALLIGRRLWDRLGGFDPRFFMYGEDVDLSLRARALGARPTYVGAFSFTHIGGASSPNRAVLLCMLMCGRVTLARSYLPPLKARLACSLFRAGVAFRALSEVVLGKRERPWGEVWCQRREWGCGWLAD
jgi:N-acetylglucosaminyl-diphospho-decaprenol L-rhamnosyltransferase